MEIFNCLHSFRTENVLKRHERLCDNNDYCNVETPAQSNDTLKYNYGEKYHLQFILI